MLQLHILYCNSVLFTQQLIECHPQLRVLGLYDTRNEPQVIAVLRALTASTTIRELPVVFTLERESFMPIFDHITLYPAFYQRQLNMDIIEKSIAEDVSTAMSIDTGTFNQVSLYFEEFSDLCEATFKEVGRCFSAVTWLNLAIQKDSVVVSHTPCYFAGC
jgi:hypothetical protein